MEIAGCGNHLAIQLAHAYSIRPPVSAVAGSIVAATVRQPVSFEAVRGFDVRVQESSAAAGVFQLYTRAADRVEAAVSLAIGRNLDVRA
ncbi:MAG: hypothetical protein L0Y42_12480 [Phycisphaerales bacterium]|nr:hypothetical protein [Phycisphaerales bacterium]